MFTPTSRLQFEAKPERPDAHYARKLQELIGGAFGEMTVTMQYLFQGWNCRMEGKYKDLIMDVATEEIGHVEMLATMVARLLDGAPAETTADMVAEDPVVAAIIGGMDPQQAIVSGGGPTLSDSNGVPWNGRYIIASGNLLADFRANVAAEAQGRLQTARLYNMTDDPGVKDMLMLADIFPTGYHATEMAGVKPGDQTVIMGGGPVGLMAAYSAILKGAGRVWVVDRHPDRLALAEKIGAIPIDDSAQDPVGVIKDATLGLGADNGCECVGYQAHDPQGNEDASLTLNTLIDAVRFTGKIGCVGVFVPSDPGGREKQRAGEFEAEGKLALDFGMMWFKGQTIGTGQCPVKKYNRALRDLIAGGRANPGLIVSHELPLDRGSRGIPQLRPTGEGVDQGRVAP